MSTRREELEKEIEELKHQIDNFEIDPYEFEDSYCEMLDEEGNIEVAGFSFSPSSILKEMDPIGYRCGLIDYADIINIEETEEYKDLEQQLEEAQEELDSLEDE